jgi:hypothetical protein
MGRTDSFVPGSGATVAEAAAADAALSAAADAAAGVEDVDEATWAAALLTLVVAAAAAAVCEDAAESPWTSPELTTCAPTPELCTDAPPKATAAVVEESVAVEVEVDVLVEKEELESEELVLVEEEELESDELVLVEVLASPKSCLHCESCTRVELEPSCMRRKPPHAWLEKLSSSRLTLDRSTRRRPSSSAS